MYKCLKSCPIRYQEQSEIIRVCFHGDLASPQVRLEEYTVIVVEGFLAVVGLVGGLHLARP